MIKLAKGWQQQVIQQLKRKRKVRQKLAEKAEKLLRQAIGPAASSAVGASRVAQEVLDPGVFGAVFGISAELIPLIKRDLTRILAELRVLRRGYRVIITGSLDRSDGLLSLNLPLSGGGYMSVQWWRMLLWGTRPDTMSPGAASWQARMMIHSSASSARKLVRGHVGITARPSVFKYSRSGFGLMIKGENLWSAVRPMPEYAEDLVHNFIAQLKQHVHQSQ